MRIAESRPIAHAARNDDGTWREPHDLAGHLAGVALLAVCVTRDSGRERWARTVGYRILLREPAEEP
jgi:CRISPR-associated endonuclease/helicase Cas3